MIIREEKKKKKKEREKDESGHSSSPKKSFLAWYLTSTAFFFTGKETRADLVYHKRSRIALALIVPSRFRSTGQRLYIYC